LHPVDPAVETTRVVAATVPDESAFPVAATHLFTTRAAEVAAALVVYFVADVVVIFDVVALPLAEVVETVMVLPATAVTSPDTGRMKPPAVPVPPVGALPLGAPPLPDPAEGAPLGLVPVGPPDVPDGAPPPNPPVVAHLPDVAAVTATVVAAEVVAALLELPLPRAVDSVTQEPTVTSAAVPATVCVILVASV